MRGRTLRRSIATSVATVIAASLAMPAGAQTATDPTFLAAAVDNHVHARQRTIDQAVNPDYQERLAEQLQRCPEDPGCDYADPYLEDWAEQGHGRVHEVTWRNRYDVDIVGRLWLPADAGRGPFPTVVFVNGYGDAQLFYLGFLQGLAEAGYAVLSFDPQCQGFSGCVPPPAYCDPDGAWREPQEFGVQEHGRCAGNPPADDPQDATTAAVDGQRFGAEMYLSCRLGTCDRDRVIANYPLIEARHVLGTIDAVHWLLSDANPHRGEVDGDRLGVVGHSVGGNAALLVGNGDARLDAAVVLDTWRPIDDRAPPRVPTLFVAADDEPYEGPRREAPDPTGCPSNRNVERFAADGVDTMLVVLRGSTHWEFEYVPYHWAVAGAPLLLTASRHGERVALHYALAWLDRALGVADDDEHLLLDNVFSGRVDAFSRGQGEWDAASRRNVPYTIGERAVADHLSPFFSSPLAFGGRTCADLRRGC